MIAKAVMDARNNLTLSENVDIKVAAQVVPFGKTDINLTLARVENCTKGGPLDICGICELVWSLVMCACLYTRLALLLMIVVFNSSTVRKIFT